MKFILTAVAALVTLAIARPGVLNGPNADDHQLTTPAEILSELDQRDQTKSQRCVQCAGEYGSQCFACKDVSCFQSCNDEICNNSKCQDCAFCCTPQESELHQRDSSPCQGCYATYDECIELCHDDVACRKACDSNICSSPECFRCQNFPCIHTGHVDPSLSTREDNSSVVPDTPPPTEMDCNWCAKEYANCLQHCSPMTDQCIHHCNVMLCGNQECRDSCGWNICPIHKSAIDGVPATPSALSKREENSPVVSDTPPQTASSCDDCDVFYDQCLHSCKFTDACVHYCMGLMCSNPLCHDYCGYECSKHEPAIDDVPATPSALLKRAALPMAQDVWTPSAAKDDTESKEPEQEEMNKLTIRAALPMAEDVWTHSTAKDEPVSPDVAPLEETNKLTIRAALAMPQDVWTHSAVKNEPVSPDVAPDVAPLPVPPPPCIGCEAQYLNCIKPCPDDPGCQEACKHIVCLNPDLNHRARTTAASRTARRIGQPLPSQWSN
ncbi:hypothetical protein BU16DRAFT_615361 [Lophium mytilinum]|uniref:Uncharacterized protein n=1 Tax=Lophium mytilinum TaxID=390894 RepID=A0A6A6R0R2_9PEZI|nr:hypothetical protein BU16DRAFT_615361 [Lophium mytilinum]